MILLNKAHYWVLKQHTDSTPQLTLSRSLTVERSFMLFRYHRVPAATQSTIPAFCMSCKSVFRDSHHKVSFLNSSTITNRQPEILLSKKPKHYTIERQSNRFWLGETPKKLFVFSSSPRRLIQLYRPLNAPATRNRVKWDTNRALKGSQIPSQTSNSLVSAFYGC